MAPRLDRSDQRNSAVVRPSTSVRTLSEEWMTAELRWSERSNLGANEQATYQGMLLNLKLLRMLAGTSFQPTYVSFPIDMFSKTIPDLERMVGCPVRIIAGRGCIAFPVVALDQPLASHCSLVYQLLTGYLDQLINSSDVSAKTSAVPHLLDRVSVFIRDNLSRGNASITCCAESLGMSARTLQMQLKTCGISYSDLMEQQRLHRARRLLIQPERTIAEIADILGYAERTSFGRAFKRWTGQSPQQFRDLARP